MGEPLGTVMLRAGYPACILDLIANSRQDLPVCVLLRLAAKFSRAQGFKDTTPKWKDDTGKKKTPASQRKYLMC